MFSIKENEEEILKFWDDNNIFKKTVDKYSTNGDYSFYDGPPFATGLPHYGHVVASVIKDLIPRYKTMQGYSVERRWGWDCHGLPVENLIEKELGFKTKKDIEDFGVAEFNKICKDNVLRYADEWKKFVPRIGRWVDMENDYKTMSPDFMESIWWVFKELYNKSLIYEDYKSMHVCSRCETSLSNFEVTLAYKDITDLSVVAKFKLKNEIFGMPNVSVLAWTTTPWTLPGNVALAVGRDIDYVLLESNDAETQKNELYILSKDRITEIFKDKECKIIKEFKGKELANLSYEPLFKYFLYDEKIENKERGWKIYCADFVTTTDGTGVVHIAPAFGEDDMNLGKQENLPFIQHVKTNGRFVSSVVDFPDYEVKPKDDTQKTDIEIIKFLAGNGTLFSKEKYLHSYPHCWRCDTPLLNYATSSWFVRVTDIKQRLLANNDEITWVPDHIKTGRFGKWLENARDWAVSRSRFWGTPLPVWRCQNDKCGKIEVMGSVEDLYKKMKGTKDKDRLTKLVVMRHGESEKNIKAIDWSKDDLYPLTRKGQEDVLRMLKEVGDDFDIILSSPVLRAKESAELIARACRKDVVIVEELREMNKGNWEGEGIQRDSFSTYKEYKKLRGDDRYAYKKGDNGESYFNVENRVRKFIESLDQYKGKKVLIITHDGLKNMIEALLKDWSHEKYFNLVDKNIFGYATIYFDNETKKEFDLHKQVVDNVEFKCVCGSEMKRIPEVFDCWFESGSMPYSSFHYPFENKELFEKRFPADFIAEGQDQTRGWFYTLVVLATALFSEPAFKNVVVNGIVLAEDGQKMSKKLKNYPDPNVVLDKYGADALRYYLMASPVVNCQDLNFYEKGVEDIVKKIILKIVNILEFYKTANFDEIADESAKEFTPNKCNNNILDTWIYAKMNKMITDMTDNYNKYYLADGTRLIEGFVDDLSNWYLRRSRIRLKSEKEDDRFYAVWALRDIMLNLALLMAPSMPFISEYIYQNLKIKKTYYKYENSYNNYKRESVHLCNWPTKIECNIENEAKIIEEMDFVKNVVSVGLSIRKQKNIPVRQPLLKINIVAHDKEKEMIEKNKGIILDELNIKNIEFVAKAEEIAQMIVKPNARLLGPKFGKDVQEVILKAKSGVFIISGGRIIVDEKWTITKEECEIAYIGKPGFEVKEENGILVSLDTTITKELKIEGYQREFISFINKLRADKGLSIKDKIKLVYFTSNPEFEEAMTLNIDLMKSMILADDISKKENQGKDLEIDGLKITIDIVK